MHFELFKHKTVTGDKIKRFSNSKGNKKRINKINFRHRACMSLLPIYSLYFSRSIEKNWIKSSIDNDQSII